MKLGNLFSKENLTAVAAGAAGAAATVPVKKFALDKIPGLTGKETLQDAATLVAGIAIGAFSKGRIGKTFGLGMSIVGAYNLVKPLLANAGLAGTVMMGNVPVETSAPMMGAVEMDFPTGGEGEMEY
mgnify:CR=1 FL=1|jgi:hypothetical protein